MTEPINPKFLQDAKVGQQMPEFNFRSAIPINGDKNSLFDESTGMTLNLVDENNDGVFDSQYLTIKNGNEESRYYDFNKDGITDSYIETLRDEETNEIIMQYFEGETGTRSLTTTEETESGYIRDRYNLNQDGIQTHITEYDYGQGKTYYDTNGDGIFDTDDIVTARKLAREE